METQIYSQFLMSKSRDPIIQTKTDTTTVSVIIMPNSQDTSQADIQQTKSLITANHCIQ